MGKTQKKDSAAATLLRSAVLIAFLLGHFGAEGAYARSPSKREGKADAKTVPSRTGTKLLVSGKYLHLSCNRSLRDLAKNRLECFGNVYVRRPNDLLTSDYAMLDLKTEQLHAEGNVVYFTADTVIYGAQMDFNFVTETGSIIDGRVESDKYQLLGQKIIRLAPDHFQVEDGEYTTCRDCPASWKIAGKKIDLTLNGYAYLNNVFFKLNDASAFYFPYAIIPVKTKRQSGLLFPHFQPASSNGFTLVQPYFWAISRSMDATLGLGFYSLRGPKAEGEFRYVLSPRSHGEFEGFFLKDRRFVLPDYNRFALNYRHNLELPGHWEQKLTYLDASDRDYVRNIGDIPGRGEPALVSEGGLSRSGRDISIWLSAKRIRNLLTVSPTGFDNNTVQLVPSVSIATADHRLSEALPLHWGIAGNYSRFWRLGPAFDPIYPPDIAPPADLNTFFPGQTPIRRAQRFTLIPEIYYTEKIADVIEIMPSVQYRTFSYLFDKGIVPPTFRGYLLAQTELAANIEKVYGEKVKHELRPSLTYSNIPLIQQDPDHPFIKQIKTPGYEFDEFDIVPISSDSFYFVPLGNSLSYRLGNKFILKEGEGASASYRKTVDLTAGQTMNFIEYRNGPSTLRALSRFFALATVDTLRITGNGEYYYYPYLRASTYHLGLNYVFARYTRRLLSFERSIGIQYDYNQVFSNVHAIGGGLNWSFNDYFGVTGGISYQLPSTHDKAEAPGIIMSVNAGVTYQSPSQCYRLVLLASRTVDNPAISLTFNIPVNLSGEGFMNLQEGGGLGSSPTGQPLMH